MEVSEGNSINLEQESEPTIDESMTNLTSNIYLLLSCFPAVTQLLNYFSLSLNHQNNLIICNQCKKAVFKKSLFHHLSTTHRYPNVGRYLEVINQLPDWNQLPARLSPSFGVTVSPIEGIDVEKGFKCNNCGYIGSKKSTIIKHTNLSKTCATFHECNIQSIFSSRPFNLIEVSSSSDALVVAANTNNSVLMSRTEENIRLITNFSYNNMLGTVTSEDNRLLSGFDAEAGWTPFLGQFSAESLKLITSMPKPTELLHCYKSYCHELFLQLHNLLRESTYETRVLFGIEGHRFAPLQNDATIDKYSLMMFKLVVFTIRISIDQSILPLFVVPEEIKQSALALEQEPVNKIAKLIDLLFLIVTQKLEYFGQRRESYLYNFANIAAFRDGQSINLNTVTQDIAALKCLSRLIILCKITPILNDQERFHLLNWVKEDKNSSFAFLHSLSKWASSHILSQPRPISIVWEDTKKFTRMIFKNHKISLQDFKHAYRLGLLKTTTILAKLLFESTIPFHISTKKFSKDDISCTRIGYGFADLHPNMRNSLAIELERFKNSDSSINKDKAKKYVKECENFLAEFLFLYHISAGQTARATEIIGFKVRNTIEGLIT